MKLKRFLSVVLTIAMLMSMLTSMSSVSAQEDNTPAEDIEFNKFKGVGVYYDASEDTTNAGTGLGMHLEVSGNPKIYSIGTEEGLAAFKADPNYSTAHTYNITEKVDGKDVIIETVNTTLGAAIETNVASTGAKYVSYTDKDQAYNFTEYEGKTALYSINKVATRFVNNWKYKLDVPNIYWMIDDDYFAPTDTHATFVVQYYDNTGSFNFKYAQQGGSNTGFTITKGGTNQWVTKVFHVTNAKLSNNLSGTNFIHGKHTGRFECGSETYISKFAILKTSDYKKIVAGLDLDFENDTVYQFMRNSELIDIETFNYPDVADADTDVINAGIPGLSVERGGTGSEGTYTKICEDPSNADNLVLAVHHPGMNWIEGATHINQVVKKSLDANFENDYIVMSSKFWYPTNGYIRFYPTLRFKKYSDNSTTTGTGFMCMFNGNGVYQEGNDTANPKVAISGGKWAEYDFVIDTKGLTADLYIDDKYTYTLDLKAGSNASADLLKNGEYYVSGVVDYKWRFDRWSGKGTMYSDDIQIRSINAEQASALDNHMSTIPGEVNNGSVLPGATGFTKQAITWSVVSEGTGVTIANNTATVPDEFYGDVTYKATWEDGTEKTYSILTCGFRTNVVTDTLDNLVYYKGKNINNYPIPNYSVAANAHKISTIEENPDGPSTDLVIKRTQTIRESPTVANTRTINSGDLNSDYFVWSVKYKIPAQYFRINLYFHYKDSSGNIGKSDGAGMNFIINGGGIANELGDNNTNNKIGGRVEKATFTTGKYANKWVEFKVIVDTKNNNGRVYIDNDYLYTHTIVRNRSSQVASGVNVCGIRMAEFHPDWGAGVLTAPAYFDDMSVSTMSTDDTVVADLKMLQMPESIIKGDTLPVTTSIAGKTITWTADNGVTIDANGVVTVPSGFKGNVTYTATVNDGTINRTQTYVVPTSTGNKYAEYIFGFDQDKAYGMNSYNVTFDYGSTGNYYTQKINDLQVRNTIVDFGKQKTFYYVVKDPAATSDTADSREVTKEEYDAFTGKKQTYTARYFNTSAQTGDSAANRYDAIGPEGDKRAAIMGVNHMRYDGRLSRKATNSMIHLNVSPTFTAVDNSVVIEVDVYDSGTHNLSLQYRTTAGTTKDFNQKLTNTGVWKTFKYELSDADFSKDSGTGLGDGAQDFRFQISTPTYISAVRVYTQETEQIAEADYEKITLRDYDVYITKDGTISAKEDITAAQAQDAKLYIAIYDKAGDLVSVATSANITNGEAATIKTGTTTSKLDPMEHSIKTFLWDSDLKPYR